MKRTAIGAPQFPRLDPPFLFWKNGRIAPVIEWKDDALLPHLSTRTLDQ